MKHTLPSYIRARRKHWHMSQRELSFLMGLSTQAVIAQHESRSRLPQAPSLFKYQALFGEPIDALIPAARLQAERELVRKARILARQLARASDRGAMRKRVFLSGLIKRLSAQRV